MRVGLSWNISPIPSILLSLSVKTEMRQKGKDIFKKKKNTLKYWGGSVKSLISEFQFLIY